MPDRNGYIGRAPSDSAVSVARQNYTSSGIATDFTFNSGYVPGYFDLYINGVKMVEGSDYTSSDGSTFSVLNGGTADGDALEAVAYKAFNAATVTNASDLTVSGDLTVIGSATFTGAGTSVSFATTAFNLSGTPDINIRNITGVAATFSGKVSYEDVVNIDSVGIVTARTGVRITDGGLVVTAGISTFGERIVGSATSNTIPFLYNTLGDLPSATTYHGAFAHVHATGKAYFAHAGAWVELVTVGTAVTSGSIVVGTGLTINQTGINAVGVITAASFVGSGQNLTNLPAGGDSLDVTASLFI